MLNTYKAEKIAQETIERMGLINVEREVIGNNQAKEFLFWVPIDDEKTIWITGEIFINSGVFFIKFYCNKIFRDIVKKNYSEILENAAKKIKSLNNSPDFKKDGGNIVRFIVQPRQFPAQIEIISDIIIDRNMNKESFQKEFQQKLEEIIKIIKRKWPYDLLE